MRVAVVGSGDLARSLAFRLRAVGHDVVLSDLGLSRALAATAAATGAPTAPLQEAVASSDLVILAIPFSRALELPADVFSGKVVVDATSYYPAVDGPILELDQNQTTSSDLLALHLGDADVVKALNAEALVALPATDLLADDVTPVACPVAADSARAKGIVMDLLVDLGFEPVDAGTLRDSWRMQPGMPAFGLVAGAARVRSALDAA